MARLKATTGDDLPVREAMLNTIPGKTPTKTYDNRSTAGNTCRFCSVPLVSETGKRSSSVPIFSATQREEHKGAKICEVLSQLGIDVQELEFKSKRCCQKCARQIFSSYKFLSDLKRNLYEERISSVKRLASGSPSVSVEDPKPRGWRESEVGSTGRARKKLSLGPATSQEPLKDTVEEVMRSFMDFPINEPRTVTKVNLLNETARVLLFTVNCSRSKLYLTQICFLLCLSIGYCGSSRK